MEKKTRTLFIGSVIAFASLLCVSIIGVSAYIITTDIESKSSNVSVQIEETGEASLSISNAAADGNIIFGPTAGNEDGVIKDSGVSGEQESLTTTISFSVSALTEFQGYVTFSIEPEDTTSTAYSAIFANYVQNGYLLDPVAGATYSDVGSLIDVVSINNGSVAGIDHTLVSPQGKFGVEKSVSSVTTSTDLTTISFTVDLTVTYGWGTYFTYMNPAEADDDGVTPNNSAADMKSVLDTMYSAFYDSETTTSYLNLGAVIGGRIDETANAASLKAEFDFASLTTSSTTQATTISNITNSLTLYDETYSLVTEDTETSVTPVSLDSVNTGNNTTGGDFKTSTSAIGFIRIGASGTNGEGSLALTFADGCTFTKAVIVAHAWTIGASDANNRGYITVNGSDYQAASTTGIASSLTYTFSESNTITISTTSSGRRAFVFSIELY